MAPAFLAALDVRGRSHRRPPPPGGWAGVLAYNPPGDADRPARSRAHAAGEPPALNRTTPLTANPGAGGRSGGPSPRATADPDAPDHYQVLGVPYTATVAEITRAYREAMKRAHPDRHDPARRAAAEEHAKAVNDAYTTLKNPIRRQAYDRTIRSTLVQDQIMSRYVGGFYPAGQSDAGQADAPRRDPTPAERRERVEADRSAFVSLVLAFAAFALVLVVIILAWSVLGSLFG